MVQLEIRQLIAEGDKVVAEMLGTAQAPRAKTTIILII